uniref:CPBP family intramembrane metalloprotease n=1 Tax=Ignisphaera aggregans TaxID=334771 RepID=A0A7J2U494_9CREN
MLDFVTAAIQLFPLWILLDFAPSVLAGAIVSKILKMPIQQIRRPVFFEPGDVTWITLVGPFFEELFFRGFPMLILGGFPGLVIGSIVWVFAHIPSRYSLIETYPRSKRVAYLFTYVIFLMLSSAFYITAWMLNGAAAILYHVIHNSIAMLATRRGKKEREKGIMIENKSENENESSFVKLRPRNMEEVVGESEEIARSMFVKPKAIAYEFENELESVEHVFVKRKRAGSEVSE